MARNIIVKGRTIVIDTTRVITPQGTEYEVVANINFSKFNPNLLTCRLGDEYYIISTSALKALLFTKRPSLASSVSIFKSVNREISEDEREKTVSLLNKMTGVKGKNKRG